MQFCDVILMYYWGCNILLSKLYFVNPGNTCTSILLSINYIGSAFGVWKINKSMQHNLCQICQIITKYFRNGNLVVAKGKINFSVMWCAVISRSKQQVTHICLLSWLLNHSLVKNRDKNIQSNKTSIE